MTRGLEKSSRKKHELYKATLKSNSTTFDREKYVTYHNNFNQIKRAMCTSYYVSKAIEFKTNVKKLWQLINNVINKTKYRGSIIPYISIDGLKTTPLRLQMLLVTSILI